MDRDLGESLMCRHHGFKRSDNPSTIPEPNTTSEHDLFEPGCFREVDWGHYVFIYWREFKSVNCPGGNGIVLTVNSTCEVEVFEGPRACRYQLHHLR